MTSVRTYEIDGLGIARPTNTPAQVRGSQLASYADVGTSETLTPQNAFGFANRKLLIQNPDPDSLVRRVAFVVDVKTPVGVFAGHTPRLVGCLEFGAGSSQAVLQFDLSSGSVIDIPGSFVRASAFMEDYFYPGGPAGANAFQVNVGAYMAKAVGGIAARSVIRSVVPALDVVLGVSVPIPAFSDEVEFASLDGNTDLTYVFEDRDNVLLETGNIPVGFQTFTRRVPSDADHVRTRNTVGPTAIVERFILSF